MLQRCEFVVSLVGTTASAVMKACKVDLGPLKESVANYIDNELETLVTEDDREPTPTAGFQRVVQRAVRSMSTRAPLYGSWVSRGMTHYDAVSFINRQAL